MYLHRFLQSAGGYDECIPIGDFSFDPNKLMCCFLESGNILAHGSGGKGYGLATTAITSSCFTWKVRNVFCVRADRCREMICTKSTPSTRLCSSTSPKRTEATRARVSEFHAGPSEIITTIPPPTCGCIALIVATCTMEENWSEHFPPSHRVTPSHASWTWRLTPYRLQRMIRFD